MNFSERNGFASPDKVIIREAFPKAIENAIIDAIISNIDIHRLIGETYREFDTYVWREIYHNALSVYNNAQRRFDYGYCFITIIIDHNRSWFEKLDILEKYAKWLRKNGHDTGLELLKATLNLDFENRNYAYRFVGDNIEEMTSKQEIKAIEDALAIDHTGIKTHLQTALQLLSPSQQEPDYRNSIKESISAVEVYCRKITGKDTLGEALKSFEKGGLVMNSQMKQGFVNLYTYTNNKTTGIRHALMNDTNAPTADEAIFMLVSCSAFINYLTKKNTK